MEDTPLKGLYALAFVLSSFAACAQTPDTPTVLFFDLDDYFGEITEVSTLPPEIIATEPMTGTSAKPAHETTDTAAGGPRNAADAPVAAIQPSDAHASVQSPIWWDDKLNFEEVTEPSTVPAQIIPEPTIDGVGEASDKAGVAIAEAADVPVRGVNPSHETATIGYEAMGHSEALPPAF